MIGSSIGSFFMTLINSAKSENLDWQQEKQQQALSLRETKTLAKHELRAKLKTRQIQLQHELTILKQGHTSELSMLQAQCDQNVRDYKQYLDSIDQLKILIQESFSHLPDAVSLTIHHHAKQILQQMWSCENIQQKLQHESQLIHFMTAVHHDTSDPLPESVERPQLPNRTLDIMTQHPIQT